MVIWASIPDECYWCFLVVAIVTVVNTHTCKDVYKSIHTYTHAHTDIQTGRQTDIHYTHTYLHASMRAYIQLCLGTQEGIKFLIMPIDNDMCICLRVVHHLNDMCIRFRVVHHLLCRACMSMRLAMAHICIILINSADSSSKSQTREALPSARHHGYCLGCREGAPAETSGEHFSRIQRARRGEPSCTTSCRHHIRDVRHPQPRRLCHERSRR